MPLQAHDFEVLQAIARNYVVTREQVHRICFGEAVSSRSTRKRLLRLREAGYISRHAVQVALPETNGAAPVYYPTKSGTAALASYFDDERFLTTNTRQPRADRLAHWIAINDTRLIVEQAVATQSDVSLDGWITEWQVVNADADKKQQFTLHTQLNENSPLSCSPDAAFLLSVRGYRKVFYLEQDRATSSPQQIAARKTKGYAELAARQFHTKHFPTANVPAFAVLLVTTNDYRCRKAGELMAKRPRPDLWLFINKQQLTPQSFLHEPIVFDHEGKLGPLVQPEDKPNKTTSVSQSATPPTGLPSHAVQGQ